MEPIPEANMIGFTDRILNIYLDNLRNVDFEKLDYNGLNHIMCIINTMDIMRDKLPNLGKTITDKYAILEDARARCSAAIDNL